MAKYTITIKSLLDNKFDFKMTSYPIFDENYRKTLNDNILNHYYEDEIGFETAPLFRFYLNQKLNEIMPYYNELYKVQKNIIDNNLLLNNVNITEELTRKIDSETNTTTESNSSNDAQSKSKQIYQQTPQGNISQDDIDNLTWVTNATHNKNNSTNTINDNSSANGTSNNTENYIKTIIGNNGNKFTIDVLNNIKNNLINIDMMIINDLEDLFMGIF